MQTLLVSVARGWVGGLGLGLELSKRKALSRVLRFRYVTHGAFVVPAFAKRPSLLPWGAKNIRLPILS